MECPNPHRGCAKERRLLREEVARLSREIDRGARAEKADLRSVVSALGARVVEVADDGRKKSATIKSLERQPAIYTNANSPSGKDPQGYENDKKFCRDSEAYEKAKRNGGGAGGAGGGDNSKAPQQPKRKDRGGGRPGHPGRSHSIKPTETRLFKADMCGSCARTDLEWLNHICITRQDFGEGRGSYTAMVVFGWRPV